jgi:hypothetical protein
LISLDCVSTFFFFVNKYYKSYIITELHDERFQSLVAGNSVLIKPLGGDFENLILEEEIDLQLELLKAHDSHYSSKTKLFPKDAEIIDVTKQMLVDEMITTTTGSGTTHDSTSKPLFSPPLPSEILAFEESVMDENTLETALICMVMAAVIFLPTFGSNFDFF